MLFVKVRDAALTRRAGYPAKERSGWWLASRLLLSCFAIVGIFAQYGLWNAGEVTALEWAPFSIAVLGFVALTWTRWRTAGTALVLLGYVGMVMMPGGFNSGLWFIILVFLVEANSRRPAWLGLTAAAVVTFGTLADWGSELEVSAALVFYAWSLTLLGVFFRSQDEGRRQLARFNELERKAERQALAANMHDSVAATLTQAVAVARAALVRRPSGEDSRPSLELIEANLSSALEELRSIVRVLEGGDTLGPADGGSLAVGLVQARDALREAGFAVTFYAPGDWTSSVECEDTAGVVLKEAVANVIRYAAPGGSVHISMGRDDDMLTLAVINQLPSVPIVDRSSGGYGLRNLAQRVKRASGNFETYSEDGAWVLRTGLPMKKGQEHG